MAQKRRMASAMPSHVWALANYLDVIEKDSLLKADREDVSRTRVTDA